MADNKFKLLRTKGTVNNGAASTALAAAPGAGKCNVITWGTIAITAAAAGGGGLVSLKDGSTVIISFPANTADTYYIELGDDGYQLSANSALNLVVESAVTTQATVFAVICGYIVG